MGCRGFSTRGQGSQFTSREFAGLIQGFRLQVSMDGKGRWVDKVLVERLWKSVKYEEVYLHACDSVSEAWQGLQSYFKFYNGRRPHSSLDGKTPDTVYFNLPPISKAA
jgi:putative transposase